MFNGATCNASEHRRLRPDARDRRGRRRLATRLGNSSLASPSTRRPTPSTRELSDTLGNPFLGDSVYVINGTTCDAANTTGCGQTPPVTISARINPSVRRANPFAIAVDQATDTIYTANIVNGEGPGTVSVINGATCNAHNTSGCDQTPATAPAGFGTAGIAVDPTTNQVYATNIEDTSVTTINGNACNGTNPTGCDDTQTRAIVGDYPGSISIDPAVATAYVADSEGISVAPLRP